MECIYEAGIAQLIRAKAIQAKNIKIAKNKWDTQKHLYQTQLTQLLEAKVLLQLNWNNLTAHEKLNLSQNQIQQIQYKKLEK